MHRSVAEKALPAIAKRLAEKNVELRGCERTRAILGDSVIPADEEDWSTEYLDYILAVRVVDSLDDAIAHIAMYSSGHSEAIITESYRAAQKFTNEVDSAAVYVNASTRFTEMCIRDRRMGAVRAALPCRTANCRLLSATRARMPAWRQS